MVNKEISQEVINEKQTYFWGNKKDNHWLVGDSIESFNKLLKHLEVKTNFRLYFEEAFEQLLKNRKEDDLVILDLGGGVGWTSSIMANHPRVKKVFLVEPSRTARSVNPFLTRHFNVPEGKVEIVKGTFQKFNIDTKVDIVVLSGAFHHCHDEFIPKLFSNIDSCLKNPYGKSTVLIANEHVVNKIWEFKRVLAFFYNRLFVKREKANRFYGLNSLRTPHPDDGEHWRSKREIDKIFENAGYISNFHKLDGDLCAKKQSFFRKIGWIYYYSLLDKIKK